jgi:hypothetical protein
MKVIPFTGVDVFSRIVSLILWDFKRSKGGDSRCVNSVQSSVHPAHYAICLEIIQTAGQSAVQLNRNTIIVDIVSSVSVVGLYKTPVSHILCS